MTGYLVRYVDLREPKPHSTHMRMSMYWIKTLWQLWGLWG